MTRICNTWKAECVKHSARKVSIAAGRNGGRITIAWYDDDDLGRLVDRLATVDR